MTHGAALGDHLEPVYLIRCHHCGRAQIADGANRAALGDDLVDHGWLLIDNKPWCPDCTDDALHMRRIGANTRSEDR